MGKMLPNVEAGPGDTGLPTALSVCLRPLRQGAPHAEPGMGYVGTAWLGEAHRGWGSWTEQGGTEQGGGQLECSFGALRQPCPEQGRRPGTHPPAAQGCRLGAEWG